MSMRPSLPWAGQPLGCQYHRHAFTMLQRRHQNMENNIILPAASEFFDPADWEALARSMLNGRSNG